MNVPPEMPAMSAPPPAPAARKSGVLKWVLIGCGGVAFIGLIVCGGCILWGVNMGKSVIKVHEEVEALVKASPEVAADIGAVTSVDPQDDQSSNNSKEISFRFTVHGENGTGVARARVKFTMTKFTLESVHYDTKDGRAIKLK
jgi:hypothetical protein